MQNVELNAELRTETGKGVARSLRRAGMIPAVVYREGKSQPIKLNSKEMTMFLRSTAGEQVLVSLKFNDGTSKLALVKEFTLDPIKSTLIHTDFFEVSLTEKIKTTVHVNTIGEPIGVKRDGGILQHGLRLIEIECLPDLIIGHIDVNVTQLLTGQVIHVSDLNIPEGIRVISEPHELIATVVAPVVETVVAPEAAAAVVAEPEVAKKGKKEETAGA